VTITDTGVGISSENMGRLFEPFFTTKDNGTGLGLAIARRIIEEHHGIIHAESEVNKGTTFSVLLPAHAPAN
jgi:signal transduction histidine kinase